MRAIVVVVAAAVVLAGCSGDPVSTSTDSQPTEQFVEITPGPTAGDDDSTRGDASANEVTGSTAPAPDPRSMTIERLRTGTLVVPFDPVGEDSVTVLQGGVWDSRFSDGVQQGRIEVQLDESMPTGPKFVDLNGDGVIEAVIAISRQSVPSGPTAVAVIADDAVVAFAQVDYSQPVNNVPLRPGLRQLRIVDGVIELTVTPNAVFEDPRLETQRYVLERNGLLPDA